MKRLWLFVFGGSLLTVNREIIPAIRQVAEQKRILAMDLQRALDDRPEYFPDKIHPHTAAAGMIAMTIFAALEGR